MTNPALDGRMMKKAALLVLGIVWGQCVYAQTNILCTAQEQWTFAEEVGRPASWAFNVSFDVQGQQLSNFSVGGLNCTKLTEVYVNDENIGFKCNLKEVGGFGAPEFLTNISRLAGDFFILRTYARSPHLDGVTIGYCQKGSRLF